MNADVLFVFLSVCVIILSVRLVIAEGRISELKGKVDSLLISLNKKEDNNDQKMIKDYCKSRDKCQRIVRLSPKDYCPFFTQFGAR